MNAGIYARISRDPDDTRLGVQRQTDDCRALCDRLGWAVHHVYEDNDRSAYRRRRRPAYTQLLDDLKAGTIGAVVAWHPDRLHRSPVELEAFIDLIEATGAKVATVQAGEYDLSTASGRMTARVVGAVARHESEQKSERLKRKHLQLAQEGKVHGGLIQRPYGYRDDQTTVVAAEAARIREAADRVLAGQSLRSIVTDWNRQRVPTVTGAPWSQTALRRVLTAPRTAGLRALHGEIMGEAVWPPILTPDQLARLRALLLDPARRKGGAPRRYLLTGLAACGICDANLVARPKASGAPCYVCATGTGFAGCGKIRRLAEPLEAWVVDRVLAATDRGVTLRPVDTGGQERVTELEARLEELADLWADGQITRREWAAARSSLLERLETARAALGSETRRSPATGLLGGPQPLREVWPDDIDMQRAVLDELIDAVVVHPAVKGRTRFDPSRVKIRWRA